ncbi:MAG: S8 family serine peptidase [Flavobacteriales bacterium]
MALNSDMRSLFFILLLSWPAVARLQTAPHTFWVRFTDKSGTPYSLSEPLEFLSQDCIDRRVRQGIGLDSRDLPVNPSYVNGVTAVGNVELHHRSKWFNAITVRIIDTLLETTTLESIQALPFVSEIKSVSRSRSPLHMDKFEVQADERSLLGEESEAAYGPSFRQISMINGHLLHEMGYTGAGRRIAVFDAGWVRTDILPAFSHLYESGRIAGTRDFVTPDADSVYFKSAHGTYVLSHMAGIIPDSLLGTAPDATYYLFRTEDVNGEYLIEEDNWVAAAEYADSLGIEIINSSLGYSRFDDPVMDHEYEDMDGETTRSSIAADIASEKGILVINSAGNSGAGTWRYITAPSDGDLVMSVGAVDADSLRAFFSSYGPSSDGDVKPNVMAMGRQTVFADLDSTIRTGNGTSFSAPIITGLAACLWQAFPYRTAREIFHAIQQSAHLCSNPNDSLGHGLPDFKQAYLMLRGEQFEMEGPFSAQVFPNPTRGGLTISLTTPDDLPVDIEIADMSGRIVRRINNFGNSQLGLYLQGWIDLSELSGGLYLLTLRNANTSQTIRIQKITTD